MNAFNMEDPSKAVDSPSDEVFRVIYRRRGSDLIFGATADNSAVQITRWNHRFKKGKTYRFTPEEIAEGRDSIKAQIEEGKYKLVFGDAASGQPQPHDKVSE